MWARLRDTRAHHGISLWDERSIAYAWGRDSLHYSSDCGSGFTSGRGRANIAPSPRISSIAPSG